MFILDFEGYQKDFSLCFKATYFIDGEENIKFFFCKDDEEEIKKLFNKVAKYFIR